MTTVVTELRDHEWGGIAQKRLDDEFYYFAALDAEVAVQRADLFESLWRQLDSLELVKNKSVIPTEVACAGKAPIAAYLYAVHQQPVADIAQALDVSSATVEQYLADVKSGRRL